MTPDAGGDLWRGREGGMMLHCRVFEGFAVPRGVVFYMTAVADRRLRKVPLVLHHPHGFLFKHM